MSSQRIFLSALACMLGAAGCARDDAPPKNPAPVEVGVVTIAPETISITSELPGRTSPYRIAEVRPQVSGIIQKRYFLEGSEVKAGQQLLQIDPSSYRAAVSNAQAALARADAQLVAAQLLVQRYESLSGQGVISKQDYDNARAAHGQALADVAAARAQLESANINLTFTRVLAPISGRIGRALATEGALVTDGQEEPLATIQQLDPIYVDVSQSSSELLRLQNQLRRGELRRDTENSAEVGLQLEDGSVYSEKGHLQFSEVSVNASTGSVLLRAVFPNPRGELLPGMFVRAQLSHGIKRDALLVPQRGVVRNRKGEAAVMLINPDSKVAERVVNAERVMGTRVLVTGGLAPGDRIVVEGLQKVRAGALVKAVPAAQDSSAHPAVSPAAQR
jgi:membrane fusion protein, multidrug efflux system